ncbi:hypothetical protein E0H93_34735 [Rhizobium leguminosarum bv. viciae]|uniref:hypothetical protein n=1 Tax=Rhizobium leguminosarum TaxID=384 RepID=UPI0010393135|nr:hypothetical protein [Rhizobium leguminosarum]MBY5530213.1 hypothetical protein [Rhizobium leguminosarum]TBY30684.1 hypothetical protein E0H55_20605 [Rhizobium leguminosarum bv. viciae]TBY35706.1 hypothetical protein E0H60_22780 [Rhizobium leguminosarum bv. viciae]TCA94796.1 hypothetical protein E0H93_34735 [Rhizobium leguminosarum bv. viciae]
MSSDANLNETPEARLLAAEDRFKFEEQIGRAESEARAQVAEKVLWIITLLNGTLFAFIAAAMAIDHCNAVKGYYSEQMVTDKLLSVFIGGIVLESATIAFCFGRLPFIKRRADKS